MEELLLDPRIRNWVLLPIMIVTFLVQALRHYVTEYMKLSSAQSQQETDPRKIYEKQLLLRARRLRTNANCIHSQAFRSRKGLFLNAESGLLTVESNKKKAEDPMSQLPMMNPMFAMDMMKRNLAMVVPQLLIGALVNFFFSGFVAVKLPFSLPQKFKTMLQRGIMLHSLDPSYVSSLSWYFLVLFGLRGLNTLLLGDTAPILDTAAMGMGTAILQMMK